MFATRSSSSAYLDFVQWSKPSQAPVWALVVLEVVGPAGAELDHTGAGPGVVHPLGEVGDHAGGELLDGRLLEPLRVVGALLEAGRRDHVYGGSPCYGQQRCGIAPIVDRGHLDQGAAARRFVAPKL